MRRLNPSLRSVLLYASITLLVIIPSCTHVGNLSSVHTFNCANTNETIKSIPGTPGIVVFSSLCIDYSFYTKKLSQAITLFVEEYSTEFDLSEKAVWEYLSNLRIEVSVQSKTVSAAFDISGKKLKETYVNGLALSDKHIWVEIKTKQINTSALIHELVHIVIWNIQGVHADPDHEGKQYSGWTIEHTQLIKRVNLRLMEIGI